MITGDETVMGIQPSFDSNGDSRGNSTPGLTIRQHFAAMAMQGFAASQFMVDDQSIVEAAKRSVKASYALIAELNNNPTP